MGKEKINSSLGFLFLITFFIGSLFWFMRLAELQDESSTRLIALLDLKIQDAFGYHDKTPSLRKY